MKRILADFISLFYPKTCIGCGRTLISEEDYICLHCFVNLPKIGQASNETNGLRNRLIHINNLDQVMVLLKFEREGIAQKMLHELKYQGNKELGQFMGQLLGQNMLHSQISDQIDLIIPIPLHPSKFKRRGFNQSELIAEGIGEEVGIPCDFKSMIRNKNNVTQTSLDKVARWKNVSNIFQMTEVDSVKDKHILLVDDVITTGATVESAASLLITMGCTSISVACVATGLN